MVHAVHSKMYGTEMYIIFFFAFVVFGYSVPEIAFCVLISGFGLCYLPTDFNTENVIERAYRFVVISCLMPYYRKLFYRLMLIAC